MRKTACWQYSICAHAVVPHAERSIGANQNLASILQLRQERKRLAYLHLQVFRGIFVDKSYGFAHIRGQHDSAGTLRLLKDGATKSLAPLRQRRHLFRQQRQHRLGQRSAICHQQT